MASRIRKLTFVLIIPRFEDIFHSYYAGEIIRGVSLASSRINADLLIHMTDRSDHSTWLSPSFMNRGYVDGILFADIDNDLNLVKKVIRAGMCCMVLNNIIDEPMNYIAMDNKKAAVEIVEHLTSLGHKNIATIAGDVSTQAGLMRLEGFKEAMDDRGLKVPRSNVTFGDFLRTPARLAAQKLLKQKDRPTAIFAASDVMALEVIDVAQSMGLKVPEELSVVGFDDNPLIISRSASLTTVAQPLVEMGRLGLENLYQISRGKARLPVKIVLPTELIKRGSIASLK
jgi:LacI family transcriptional regulator